MDPRRATRVLYVVTGAGIERWRAAGVDKVASFDPRSPAQRREAEDLHRRIVDGLTAEGRADVAATLDTNYWALIDDRSLSPGLRSLIERYTGLGLPTAVFLLPPDVTPPA
jgi:hypothetical protein